MKLITILWVDDEIDHLKAHIRFLEKRSYEVIQARSGREALDILRTTRVDLVLMDQMMVGMDGLETVHLIRKNYRDLPVVMVTQSEEEELMDRALSGTIADFLTKPVNPSQILLVVKRLLDSGRLRVDRAATEVISETQKLRLSRDNSLEDWIHLFKTIMDRDISLGGDLNEKLQGMQGGALGEVEADFSRFIENNYRDWLESPDNAPVMAHNVLGRKVVPELLKGSGEVVFLVMDCMRYDQWLLMMKSMEQWFHRESDFMIAGIPSATPYSRNSIFSGLVPRDIWRFYRTRWVEKYGCPGLNSYEQLLMRDGLVRNGFSRGQNAVYAKVSNSSEGENVRRGLSHFLKDGFMALVVNFIDHLAHGRSELDLIRDIAPDVPSFRRLAKEWFDHSFLLKMLKTLSARGATVIVTSDHGSVLAGRIAFIRGARGMSHSVRYRFGHSLFADPKNALVVHSPAQWGLPDDHPRKSYLFARDDYLLMQQGMNRDDRYKFKGSFQHGGLSMEEMLVPCDILRPKKFR
ncbi:MAG TPA: response regulator [Candidatus Sabulitectum sp.]|nr:response regulator [Candidatus Sabulitectum sp.]